MSGIKKQTQAAWASKKHAQAQEAAPPQSIAAAALLQALPDAVMALDAAGAIRFANHAALSFAGMGEKAVLGQTLAALFGEASPLCAVAAAAARGGHTMTVRDIDLLQKPVPVATLSLLPDHGDMLMLSWRIEKSSFSNEWLTQQRTAMKPAQHMARTLAHEVKNPLAGIRGAAQLLGKSASTEDDRALASLIDAEAERILRLVDKINVMDVATPAKMQPVNLHDVTDHVAEWAHAGFAGTCTLRTDYDPSLPEIMADRDALVQAVMNLVKNAVEAEADMLVLRTGYDLSPPFHPETGQRLPIVLSVEDNGSGMSAETAARLFEPCFTTKPQGEGLGLAVVSRIVDAHGGMIGVTAREGRTAFRLSLPVPPRKKGEA